MGKVLNKLYRAAYGHNRNQCGMLEKSFGIKDWVSLVFGEAQMFCLRHKFPDIETWAELDNEFNISQYGILVNKGDVNVSEKTRLIVIGDTTATILCDRLQAYYIVLMHGATVNIIGRGHAVVFTRNDGTGVIETELTDGAIVQEQ